MNNDTIAGVIAKPDTLGRLEIDVRLLAALMHEEGDSDLARKVAAFANRLQAIAAVGGDKDGERGCAMAFVRRGSLDWLSRNPKGNILAFGTSNGEDVIPLYTHQLPELSVGELFRKLLSDCNTYPCNYPCLRDDLYDWLCKQPDGETARKYLEGLK